MENQFNHLTVVGKEDDSKVKLMLQRIESLKKLPQFCGIVNSKNDIKKGKPKEGGIYWSVLDKQAFVVLHVGKNHIDIQPLSETTSISTGMTIYELNKKLSEQEPLFDFSDKEAVEKLNTTIKNWFNSHSDNNYFLLYGREIHYVTLIKTNQIFADEETPATLIKLLGEIGSLISLEPDTINGAMEIWMRTFRESATMLYLLPYDNGLVVI